MELKDYYATLGVERAANDDEVKLAYRKLARKYHPDVSKEADAEARFKDVREAYEVLSDPEKRAAYDDVGQRYGGGPEFQPPPGWNSGFEFSGTGARTHSGTDAGMGGAREFSDFFESLFGRSQAGAHARGGMPDVGGDQHAKIVIDLSDAYTGARRTLAMRVPVRGPDGQVRFEARQLEVNIPKGVRAGQHLRLAGQGTSGAGGSGDLYLEIEFAPHPHFRVDGRDIYLDLPLSPWEAALGAQLTAPTPGGSVQLTIPKGSATGRKLRLKGKGLPGAVAGDMYVLLSITTPAADNPAAVAAYEALARAVPSFNPRSGLEI